MHKRIDDLELIVDRLGKEVMSLWRAVMIMMVVAMVAVGVIVWILVQVKEVTDKQALLHGDLAHYTHGRMELLGEVFEGPVYIEAYGSPDGDK